MPARSPASGQPIGTLPRSSREDAQRAVAAARDAQAGWAEVSVWERADACLRIAAELEARRERVADMLVLEQGKPRAEAEGEVGAAVAGFRLAAEEVRQLGGETIPTEDGGKLALTIRQPRGVFAVVTPWNFPINIPVEYLGPAIASGCAVVWTPAPTTAFCAIELAEAIEAAGLPAGVVNLVIGEGPVVGDEIVSHPGTDGIGFTGSTATGQRIAERGAGKQMLLELGGNGPVIVFDDADLDRAAEAAAAAAFLNAGQVCSATERVLVHRDVVDAFADKVARIAKAKVLGDPAARETQMGPLNNAQVAQKTREHVEDALNHGATLLAGGRSRDDLGSELFYEPTVLTGVTADMRINREETFGPVVPILAFDSDDEALALALDNDYGLTSSVFTRDLGRALRFGKSLRSGIVNVNEAPSYWELHLPFGGGAGRKSGTGRIGGRHTLEAMTVIKTIVLQA
ncbi:succinate-semialdehyde dehydrogenase (NADP+) [Oceanicola granulosus HTCC2516]|uniref:Succinate-semialdehyde dehydrogenase (NADP+) n=1 Tax=Oceanicola granulosus (strain ATCC BAA-861 / DSM 15982 / KCTC 12143 / HTCC2516) TaxID=314256 RepID=Q2CF31_OCEGH|nr:aldehyde dehydrogenase family protein [Oceanicola granulosus]EAR51296.1 succinate-semialdehyde dehydrogenase (NADP+) [Oceanicola granulosus HTCC2516]